MHVGVGERNHDFEARTASRGRVGVNRGQRAVVTGVHGLQHVERFFAADFADHDAVGAHTQAVDQQFALPHRAVAFQFGGRVSSRTTCGCFNWSSAASSMVTMRSCG